MNLTTVIGILGGLVLVAGAAMPSHPVANPLYSRKNWLFAIGGFLMFAYALLGYVSGGPIFFVILQILVNVSSILMMLRTSDRFDTAILGITGVAMVAWSLSLFEGYRTVVFILGLCGIGLGYAFEPGSVRRVVSLLLGSVLIAVFSYLEASWIFFWLNVFFAVFSAIDLRRVLRRA